MNMPFGKHRGKPIAELPASYLVWCLTECEGLNSFVRREMIRVIREWLDEEDPTSYRVKPGPPEPSDITGAIRRWHRQLAQRFHPDSGGQNGQMVVVNEAVELLKRELKA